MTDKAKYTERESGPGEETRGQVLDTLAAGSYWAFLLVDLDPEDSSQLSLKLEMDDRLTVRALRNVLRQTLDALPEEG